MNHSSLVLGLKKRTDPFFTLSINLAKEITVEFQLEADTVFGTLKSDTRENHSKCVLWGYTD